MQATSVIFALVLVNTAAHAQKSQSDSSGTTQETTPISGIDEAAYAGSARASKLIGSKVYKATRPSAVSRTCWSTLMMPAYRQ
jgi:hypothetical protein